MFHRQYMHKMLKDSASGEGGGIPAKLVVNHKVSGPGPKLMRPWI
jgi:salicylate hydroxylase